MHTLKRVKERAFRRVIEDTDPFWPCTRTPRHNYQHFGRKRKRYFIFQFSYLRFVDCFISDDGMLLREELKSP